MALLLAQTQTQTHESKTEFPVHTEEDILEHNVAVDWHSQSHMALAYLSPQAPPPPPLPVQLCLYFCMSFLLLHNCLIVGVIVTILLCLSLTVRSVSHAFQNILMTTVKLSTP